MTAAILVFLWWLTGFVSFTYWWTAEQDLKSSDLMLGLVVAVIGPVAFIVGWVVSTPTSDRSKVLIKRRK